LAQYPVLRWDDTHRAAAPGLSRLAPGVARGHAAVPERPTPQHVKMIWAARLKRVFAFEIGRCARCDGRLQVIASIEEPELIERILAHRRERGAEDAPVSSLGPRAPPQASLF
jgi:hypothetical protein